MKFELIDDDNGKYDLIGSHETTMAIIMGSKAQTISQQLDLKGDKKKGKLGTVIVRAEAVKDSDFVAFY
jgi:hypothetical protein